MAVEQLVTTGNLIVAGVALIVPISSAAGLHWAWKRERRREMDDAIRPLTDRMTIQETTAKDFMPGDQIKDGFRAAQAASAAIALDVARLSEGQIAIRERLARTEQNGEATNASIIRIERTQHEMDQKIDRLLERRP